MNSICIFQEPRALNGSYLGIRVVLVTIINDLTNSHHPITIYLLNDKRKIIRTVGTYWVPVGTTSIPYPPGQLPDSTQALLIEAHNPATLYDCTLVVPFGETVSIKQIINQGDCY